MIELVVVLAIVSVVTAASVPMLTLPTETTRLRESARLLTVALEGARLRAAASGQPAGVALLRSPTDPLACVGIAEVETPLPYGGDNTASRIRVAVAGATALAEFTTGDTGWYGLVRPGDLIRLDYQGPLFRINGAKLDERGFLAIDSQPWWLQSDGGSVRPTAPGGSPFQIYLRPRMTGAAPTLFPAGAAVDLSASGISAAEWSAPETEPLVLMFNANGSVQRVYLGNDIHHPTQAIHLLIGARDQVAFAPEGNWLDLDSLWVTVNSQNGRIATAPNATVDVASLPFLEDGLPLARRLATAGRQLGGR